MSVSISAPVGYHGRAGGNRPADVSAVHDLLARVPAASGGPGPGFNARAGYSANTDTAIFNFQKANRLPVADATVNPGQETLARLNMLATPGGPGSYLPPTAPPSTNPPPGPPTASLPPTQPGVSPDVEPIPMLALVTANIVGHAYVKGYDNKSNPKKALGRFRVPLYRLKIGRADVTTTPWSLAAGYIEFDVIRFGVAYDSTMYEASPTYKAFRMQGPPRGEFTLARNTYMGGSWLIKGNYFIHDGPNSPHHKGADDKLKELAGALGCVELCWPQKMATFDECVRLGAFGNFYEIGFYDADEADRRITDAKAFRCVVEPAGTPPLLPLTDFRNVGGPPPIAG